jgi:CxxC-x17-CxxC domain-containing protein
MYQDETLVCKECGAEFVFTAQEQEFFAEKGFANKPTRCRSCRIARKSAGRNDGGNGEYRSDREMYDAVCAQCGKPTQIPFRPKNDRPVYCRDCFNKKR